MESPKIVIVPECRYGHGSLFPVEDEQDKEWVVLSATRMMGSAFGFRVFVCLRCGYSELFDALPGATETAYKKS